MSTVLFLHWKKEEIAERAARLRRAGYRVSLLSVLDGETMRSLRDDPPAALIIDLARLPSHGRAVALALRQEKGTRHVPIVFVGGEPEKIARVRRELPDAIYTDWPGIGGAMKKALAWKNEKPVVPGAMAGYSGTPLPRKLGVDGQRTVLLMSPPSDFDKAIELTKGDARLVNGPRAKADLVMLFVKTQAELKRGLPKALRGLADGGGLWIAWPKKSSGVASDLSESVVRTTGLKAGLVDYKVCAIDDTWSGLKFTRRRLGKTKSR